MQSTSRLEENAAIRPTRDQSGTYATDPKAPGRNTLAELNRFARSATGPATLQVVTTLGLSALIIECLRLLATSPGRWILAVVLGLTLIRVFVLQHDCGHHSLFPSKRANDVIGTVLSWLTWVPYEPWRTEHAWHHTHQGQLDVRGIDRVNSPMTTAEARRDPEGARRRSRLIRVVNVILVGFFSLHVKRKRLRGFFHYRPGFRWRIANPDAQLPGFVISLAGAALLQVVCVAVLGVSLWATCVLPAYFLATVGGVMFFWTQHNFEHTFHAEQGDWTYVDAGLRGSSYVALPRVLRWFTADIGIHHVHHLHPRIPNYRLEAARLALPETAAVRPLTGRDFLRCFTHIFWDPAKGRMVPLDEV